MDRWKRRKKFIQLCNCFTNTHLHALWEPRVTKRPTKKVWQFDKHDSKPHHTIFQMHHVLHQVRGIQMWLKCKIYEKCNAHTCLGSYY
jgi:hypothetical protein